MWSRKTLIIGYKKAFPPVLCNVDEIIYLLIKYIFTNKIYILLIKIYFAYIYNKIYISYI